MYIKKCFESVHIRAKSIVIFYVYSFGKVSIITIFNKVYSNAYAVVENTGKEWYNCEMTKYILFYVFIENITAISFGFMGVWQ